MPRCGAEGIVTHGKNSVNMDIDVVAAGDNRQVDGAIIFRVLRGEWHHTTTNTGKVVMDTTRLLYPQMDLVVKWPPAGPSDSPSLYLPDVSNVGAEALDGLGILFGINPSTAETYTSSAPDGSSPDIKVAWMAYSCLLGDERPNGDKITEVIMTEPDGTKIKGGWVFAEPDGTISPGDLPGATPGGDVDTGPYMTLSANRFAIIGGELGALFGPGRKLYFETGVDETMRVAIRQEFGFGANEGEDAYIRVRDFVHDFLLEVTPE
ncbi:MAG TPA: hypothetical protein VJ183_09110 [Chloroflexia bacterium]|nr:hypothetical protein [Chloroflexia bacterium]